MRRLDVWKLAALALPVLMETGPAAFAQPIELEGPSGGTGGQPFDDAVPVPQPGLPTQLVFRSGSYIDSLQFSYDNGVSLKHGGNGGQQQTTWNLVACEIVTNINGKYGSYVDSMSISTNKRKGQFGGSGGDAPYNYTAPPNFAIVGFAGRSGNYIDAIGVRITPIPIQCQ